MATRPLLIFPRPEPSPRLKKSGGPSRLHFPSHRQQVGRIGPKLTRLQQAFATHRAQLQVDPGREPERVLVLETIEGVDQFFNAVRRIRGFEWLAEWEEESIPPDESFYLEDEPEHLLRGRLYLIMSDQRAMDELVRLWRRYQRDPNQKLDHGLNRWREVFRRLRDIRFWDAEDRVDPNLARWLRHQLAQQRGQVVVKTEFWFSSSEQKRAENQQAFERLLRNEGGRVLGQVIIPQIAFHAVAAEIPAQVARQVIELGQSRLVRCNEVMFYKPLGQSVAALPSDDPAGPSPARPQEPGILHAPVVALLDGLPLERHTCLQGRIIVDDPDGWGANYPADQRVHGTMMSSLVINGELDSEDAPLESAIYVRPIMRPDVAAWRGEPVELIPEDVLPEDIVHRAVVRLLEGEPGTPPPAPNVRIVTFAIGDPLTQFARSPSPLARLLDWLAWRYRILFLVSAGNHTREFHLNVPRGNLRHLQPQDLQRETLVAVENDSHFRRLLSPAEAINALTVSALHSDSSHRGAVGPRINPYIDQDLPSPICSVGPGYRRAVKPDMMLPGGRQLFVERLGNAHRNEILEVRTVTGQPPGQRAAAPGRRGELTATRFYCGTSGATALAARTAARLFAVITELRQERGGGTLDDRYTAVLLKTMLAHGCSWEGPRAVIEPVFMRLNRHPFREVAPRFLGYGVCRPERVFGCTAERATLIGCGELGDGDGHVYGVPLPPSLGGMLVWRRLTITLSWLTPINPFDRYYRRAVLWFDPPQDELRVTRREVDWQMVQRGTLQHEILEGEQATAFVEGQALTIQVNCRAQVGSMDDLIPYAIAVSLEVAPGTLIPVYEQIRDRLRVGIAIEAPEQNP